MKKTFKGLVVCTMLSSSFAIPLSSFAAHHSAPAVASNEVFEVVCKESQISQPAKEECVISYIQEETCVAQPAYETYAPKKIVRTVRQEQPPIIEYIPVITKERKLAPQPDRKIRVPVITYQDIFVKQEPKEYWVEHMTTEKKVTARPAIEVEEISYEFPSTTQCQESTKVTLNHPKIERQVTAQPDMASCETFVEVKAPLSTGNACNSALECVLPAPADTCAPAPADTCTKAPAAPCTPAPAACTKAPAASKAIILIKNDTKLAQKFTFFYSESRMSKKTLKMEVTLEASDTKTITVMDNWHHKTVVINGKSIKAQTGQELLLSKLTNMKR